MGDHQIGEGHYTNHSTVHPAISLLKLQGTSDGRRAQEGCEGDEKAGL